MYRPLFGKGAIFLGLDIQYHLEINLTVDFLYIPVFHSLSPLQEGYRRYAHPCAYIQQ